MGTTSPFNFGLVYLETFGIQYQYTAVRELRGGTAALKVDWLKYLLGGP